MEFRKDINGLRAIAVLAVMLYHFGLGGFRGGYAGVDVFFVISGFLMTGIVLKRQDQGRFSLTDFYLARAKRIIPALLAVAVTLLIFGYFWLIPSDFETLGKHAAAAVTFVSNFVFKGEDGYFDAPMRDKWMLHTWSLAVEWQYYLLYPLLLVALRARKKAALPRILFSFLAASLLLSALLTPARSAFCFYLLPARIWEFMLGALVYIGTASPRRTDSRVLQLFGLTLIAASFFIFDDDSLWPGLGALVPAVGTALVIFANRESSRLTGNAVAQWIGTTSYSIYLWHWPVFVGLVYFGADSRAWMMAGFAASLLLGTVSYLAIEQPGRTLFARVPAPALPRIAAITALVACAGLIPYISSGLPSRVAPELLAIDRAADDTAAATRTCGKKCRLGRAETRFILIGDSHASAIAEAVTEASGSGGLLYSNGCPTIFNALPRTKKKSSCGTFNNFVLQDIQQVPRRVPVIISNRYAYYLLGHNQGLHRAIGLTYTDIPDEAARKDETSIFKKKLTESLCKISATHKTYALLPIAEIGRDVPKTVARHWMAGRAAPPLSVSKEEYAARNKAVLAALQDAQAQCGVTLLDPRPYLCENGICSGLRDGKPLYFDDNHLNREGTRRLVPLFRKIFTRAP